MVVLGWGSCGDWFGLMLIGDYRCTGHNNKLVPYELHISVYNTEYDGVKKYMVPRVGVITIAFVYDHYTVKGMGDHNVIRDYPSNATVIEMLKFTIPEMSKTILTAEVTEYMDTLF